jgi:hypothetical protein
MLMIYLSRKSPTIPPVAYTRAFLKTCPPFMITKKF